MDEPLKSEEILAGLICGPSILPHFPLEPIEESVHILKYLELNTGGLDDRDERLVYGIVIRPDRVDGHLDIMTSAEVQKTAHRFLANGGTMGIMHEKKADAIVVESYIAPVDFLLGTGEVKKGDWVVVSLVIDDLLWSRIKSGELRAYSPGGKARARVIV